VDFDGKLFTDLGLNEIKQLGRSWMGFDGELIMGGGLE
jgi:hypothetical protein